MALPIIKEIKSILKFAKKAFTKGSFRYVTQYVNGLVSLAKKTVKKISEASSEIKHQSRLNYVLTEAKFEEEILKQRYLKKIKHLFKNTPVYLIIDDTLIERNGKAIEEAQKHFNHNDNDYINGHQFFTAILWTPFLQLPLFPQLYSKNTDSKIEMAQSLIDTLEVASIKIHTVLFDSWYSEQELIRKCVRTDARVICAVKTNRKIMLEKENKWRSLSFISKRIRSQKLTKIFIGENTYEAWSSIVKLNNLPSIKLIISEERKRKKVIGKAHLISTNQEDTVEEIIRAYKIRWCIETYHRDIKQNLGFAKVFFRRREGIVRHAILASMTYAVLGLFMYRKGISMTIGECCEYLRDKSNYNLVKEIVEIEDKPTRLNRFEEVFISESRKL
ncbi:MAG: transposase [Nanoarchaeota archaeon]|nr:transposase [Nanoarchaeota archaeon]